MTSKRKLSFSPEAAPSPKKLAYSQPEQAVSPARTIDNPKNESPTPATTPEIESVRPTSFQVRPSKADPLSGGESARSSAAPQPESPKVAAVSSKRPTMLSPKAVSTSIEQPAQPAPQSQAKSLQSALVMDGLEPAALAAQANCKATSKGDLGGSYETGDRAPKKTAYTRAITPNYRDSDWLDWMEARGDLALFDYFQTVQQIQGHAQWCDEQKKLHMLIWMRGHHPVFPATWEFNFLMWGFPWKLYREPGNETPVAIQHMGNEFRATKAFESLLDLSIKIADYDWMNKSDKVYKLIVDCILEYVDWAHKDAGVWEKQVVPVIGVYHYSPDYGFEEEEAGSGSERKDKAENEESNHSSDLFNQSDQTRVLQSIQTNIEEQMNTLAEQHRRHLTDGRKESGWTYTPPIVFGYAVIHNVVVITSLDTSNPQAKVMVLEQISLDDPAQWLWNALSIAIPIHHARNWLYDNRDHMGARERVSSDEDPDA